MEQKNYFDIIIIGAGISGVVFLKYAKEYNFKCLVLEKQNGLGGLWNKLPYWQDIQNKRFDFTINKVPLQGVKQKNIQQFTESWVNKYHLRGDILLNTEVTSVARANQKWTIQTSHEAFISDHLVVASGIQNEAFIPNIERFHSNITEFHSSELHQPDLLKGKRVTIVGGGTSSWDLCEQSLRNSTKKVDWIYRSNKWFFPTGGSKHTAWPNIREMAVIQSILRSIDGTNVFLRGLLKVMFKIFPGASIKPSHKFDQRKDQLIPGRSYMLRNLDKIEQHIGQINQIKGRELILKNDKRIETDILLWGTGYKINLGYLGLPEYSRIKTLDEIFPRLGTLMLSLDYPNMYFVGMPLLGSTSATPFFSAIEAKTILAHIAGKCTIPKEPILHQINHWDLFRYFAHFDHHNYHPFFWKIKYFLLSIWYLIAQRRSIRI